MSSVAEQQITPIPIAEMGPWFFWSRELIGATPEERAAHKRGELSVERVEQLVMLGLKAREQLAQMPVPGFQEWMIELRRRLN